MIKKVNDTNEFYLVSSGDWSTVVLAENKSSALEKVFKGLLNNPKEYGGVGKIVICMNIDQAINELTLEESLKFIPTEEAIGITGQVNIWDLISTDEDEY